MLHVSRSGSDPGGEMFLGGRIAVEVLGCNIIIDINNAEKMIGKASSSSFTILLKR
jgi:hypothetical protein